ncbi:glycosyltransferase [bacterium]|nr:MAG: glycosyltransferase [bacterium]
MNDSVKVSGSPSSVSLGICAYNEEKNIGFLLQSILNQKTVKINIKEIIVISDGSGDRTDEITRTFFKDGRIRLLRLNERLGKYAAVNEFLKHATCSLLVLSSADVVLDENAIERLCLPFLTNNNIGITGAHPLPKNSADSFLGYVVNLQWYLHHKISLVNPKFGELIAFRNVVAKLPPTFVDEEELAYLIRNKGYKPQYIPESLVYNLGPNNLTDFFKQRSRIYAGHIMLKNKYSYEAATLSTLKVLRYLLKNLTFTHIKKMHWLLCAIFAEGAGRMLGILGILFNKNYYKWEISESTKDLNHICNTH